MKKIFDIVWKDIQQTLRSPLAGLFLIVMPLMFTAFFGLIFQGVSSEEEVLDVPVVALVVGDERSSAGNGLLVAFTDAADLKVQTYSEGEHADPRDLFMEESIDAVLYIPAEFDFSSQRQTPAVLYVDETTSTGQTIRYAIERILNQEQVLYSTSTAAVQAVNARLPYANDAEYQTALEQIKEKAEQIWNEKAVTVSTEKAVAPTADLSAIESAYDQSSPGMLVQFTITGLMGTAIILVRERKTKTLQRMLTTATSKTTIIIAHALSMFFIIVVQQIILVLSGKFLFGVDYLREPLAIFLVVVAFALWVTGMGILIGVLAKNEDQVILFSLIAMFVFTAMGGAWFPLEGTSASFYNIARLTPGAQAMQGFQNIILRKQDLSSVFAPVGMLLLYAAAFFTAAIALFKVREA
ncbi:MAG: ABC transporter permease [Anaerolineaceae bacterium]|jgi:ABC-2 type transport system permease protein|nr:MAG: ABC transporter permease [Anaerolineaceae bacterium]